MSKPRLYISVCAALSSALLLPTHARAHKAEVLPASVITVAASSPSNTLPRGWMWNLDNLPEGVMDRLASTLTLPGSTARKPRPPGFRTMRMEGVTGLVPLQQELLRATLRRLEGGAPCPGDLPPFANLLNQATDALDFVEKDRAREVLTLARLHLQCGATPLPHTELARLAFLSGVLDLYSGVNNTVAFEQALIFRPDYPEPTTWPAQVGKSFRAARQKLASPPQLEVQVEHVAAGFQLWVDGKSIPPGPLKLTAGTHIIQWATPQGVLIGARTLELKTPPKDLRWPSPELCPLDENSLRERLANLIRNKGGDELLVNVLLSLARENQADYLVLAGKINNGEAAALYLGPGVLQASASTPISGTGSATKPPSSGSADKPTTKPPSSTASTGSSPLPWVRTGAIGAATVGFAAGYGSLYARYVLGGESVENEAEAQQISTLSGVFLGGAVVGAAATTVSALHAAGVLKLGGGGEDEASFSALPLALPGTLGILLSGRW